MRRLLLTLVLGTVLALGALVPTATGHQAKDTCAGGHWTAVDASVDPAIDANRNGIICEGGKGVYRDDHYHPKK